MTAVALVVSFALLLLAGWLRAAGTTVSRIPRADALRDAADGVPGAEQVSDLLDERQLIQPAVGMVETFLLVVSAVVGLAAVVTGESLATSIGLAILVAVVIFFVGDLLPRQIGRRSPKSVAYRASRLLAASVRIGGWASELLPDAEDGAVAASLPDDEGDEQERELIDSVLEFGETIVREVMTPRPDMVMVGIDASIDDLIGIATEEGFSRIPITANGDVVGMVIVKDLLPRLGEGQRPSISEVMRQVEFIPESKLASVLLAEMQANHTHQMIVVDEYGDVAGLVTIEDLLEELVGEITDETDDEEVLVVSTSPGVWDVDARVAVDELSDICGVTLPHEDWDTVGGLVLGLAERVPEEGEVFAYGDLTLRVTRMQGRRVSSVQIAATQTSVETQ